MSAGRALVGMSGGVDSSVAAALLIEEGFEVVGVTLRMTAAGASGDEVCSGAEQEAGRIAAKLGIPHSVLDLRDEFSNCVLSHFVKEYAAGHTPNPCVMCNPHVKFEALLRHARQIEADVVATGHYARIERGEDGCYRLLRGVDRSKDQSYVLYRLNQEQLSRLRFPLGAHLKRRVREMAQQMELPVSDRPESQDICFSPDGRYSEFLRREAPELVRPGSILDRSGKVVGSHDGIAFFTVGQRRGTRVASGERLYVVEIDAANNAVILGRAEELLRKQAVLGDAVMVSGQRLSGRVVVSVRIRYNTQDQPAVARPLGPEHVELVFEEGQPAVTPGQSAVMYNGDELLGGGIIADRNESEEAVRAALR